MGRWLPEHDTFLIEHYLTMPLQEIVDRLGFTDSCIKKKAAALGIRKYRRWTEADFSYLREHFATESNRRIAKAIKSTAATVGQIAHTMGLRKIGKPGLQHNGNCRVYKVPTDLFVGLNPASAYMLGFVYADGYIDGRGCLSLSNTDKDLLGKILAANGLANPVKQFPANKYRGANPLYYAQIWGKDLVALVRKHGITERKSLTCRLPAVAPELFGHFLRGYFDGDGCVRLSGAAQLCIGFVSGSQLFLADLAAAIAVATGTQVRPVTQCKNPSAANFHYRLSYPTRLACLLRDLMYADCGSLYMVRKRERFEAHRQSRAEYMNSDNPWVGRSRRIIGT